MNEAFRKYVFGRSFNLSLSERHVDALALLCRQDAVASYGIGVSMGGLLRRGLVEYYHPEGSPHGQYRPTRAGMLVYDLLVEAGEHQQLEAQRREALEMEQKIHEAEWNDRFGDIQIKFKERFLQQVPEGSTDA